MAVVSKSPVNLNVFIMEKGRERISAVGRELVGGNPPCAGPCLSF